jgi:hypothetical protein
VVGIVLLTERSSDGADHVIVSVHSVKNVLFAEFDLIGAWCGYGVASL